MKVLNRSFSLIGAALLGILMNLSVVGESHAVRSYGETVNAFCPSQPFTGDCTMCHDSAGYSRSTPAMGAFLSGDLCYFCPFDAPCLFCTDSDGDSYNMEGGDCGPADCDDTDPTVHPGAVEDCSDGVDNDCNGLVDSADPDAVNCPPDCTDLDGDGYSVEGADCGPVDCDDWDAAVYPGAVEDCSDGMDNDCDGLVDDADPDAVGCPPACSDLDGDGYGIEGGDCGPVDCDDAAAAVHPGAVEDCSDGIDNDCDGLVDGADPDAVGCAPGCADGDGDGYMVGGGECGPLDCDDTDPAVYPGAVEDCSDGMDNDCDGLVDDADPDAVGCPPACSDLDGDGYGIEGGDCGPVDCDDAAAAVHPGAVEDCSDGIDNDCDGLIDAVDPDAVGCEVGCTDADGDGYAAEGGSCGPVDCNDQEPAVNPGAKEICKDRIDNDCDGRIDRRDRQCRKCGRDDDRDRGDDDHDRGDDGDDGDRWAKDDEDHGDAVDCEDAGEEDHGEHDRTPDPGGAPAMNCSVISGAAGEGEPTTMLVFLLPVAYVLSAKRAMRKSG